MRQDAVDVSLHCFLSKLQSMVAFSSTRRRTPRPIVGAGVSPTTLLEQKNSVNLGENATLRGSRRSSSGVEIVRDASGRIIQARIGRWRVVSAAADRDILEVHQASCGRTAIRLARCANRQDRASCEVWQLYDDQGRLLASLQRSADGRMAVISDYQLRQASRLVRTHAGEMECVESWNI
ncbi:hypothetical protein [Lacipirellula parvula]|uniref:Uncharacterized protein n=1 Tax=Lacipirellula parvula TaxID=2650471 RepID=A0A5K7X2W6_9BACT|nr:hypothetical protein [Lacipirellula parvula]BBO30685.1 hypothetical protein PLANPX_0297 [Lacipirellula parvula]